MAKKYFYHVYHSGAVKKLKSDTELWDYWSDDKGLIVAASSASIARIAYKKWRRGEMKEINHTLSDEFVSGHVITLVKG